MKKLLLLVSMTSLILASSGTYIDNTPSKITLKDLKHVKKFDKLAYNLAEEEEMPKINITNIVNYIWRNRLHIEDYTRLKLDTLGTLGYRTPRGSTDNSALVSDENYNYYKVGLALTYNLYDGKTSKDIQNQKLTYRTNIINEVQKYTTCKNDLQEIKIKLKMKRLEQIRSKIMVKTAQKYLDDRLKIIENIMQLKINKNKKADTCNVTKLRLLNMVTPSAKNGLKDLL